LSLECKNVVSKTWIQHDEIDGKSLVLNVLVEGAFH
jgi:hypothetical protein